MTNATYDGRNRLIWVDQSGTGTTYRYDEDGWRIAKNRPGFPVEYYVREGPLVLAEVKVDGSGNVSALHFNVVAGAQVVGRQPSAGSRLHYHTDMLGSVRSVVAGTSVVESYDYDPWGVRMPGRTLGSGTKEGFTGKERDPGTALDYFGARYYMSALGRWASVDPVADSFPEWSVYNYVENNPVSYTDPFGLCPMCIVAGAWALYEIGSGIYDAYNAVRTVADPSATAGEKIGTVALAAASFGLPGGGYTAAGRRVGGILREGGELIGRAGSGRGVREVVGSATDARSLFGQLTEGAEVVAHPGVQGGLLARLPGGGTIGYRPTSRSGPVTIDVNVPGVDDLRKIKFLPGKQ